MSIDEQIAVLTAYKEGKQIQYSRKNKENWNDTPLPCWDFDTYDYRIKPEPKYRPYKSVEEILEAIREHGMYLHRGSPSLHLITNIYPRVPNAITTLRVTVNGKTNNVEELLGCYTWPDGTPFGVREE